MKLLFDQNISFRLIKKISVDFPEARQVRELGLDNSTDKQIWDFARKENYSIVTFDTDFYDLSSLYGHPPKIIWLRTGNTDTESIARLLTEKKELITAFLLDPLYKEIACIELI